MHNLDIGHRDPELVRDDLGERRLFALTVRVAPRIGGCLSGRMEPDGRGTPKATGEPGRRDDRGRTEPADLDVRGQADSHQLALPAALCLLLLKLLVADLVEGFLARPRIISAIVRAALLVRIRAFVCG